MLYLGADHGGFALKEQLKTWLDEWGIEYTDLGAATHEPDDDYPQYALAVAQAVGQDPVKHRGILTCRSAAGMVFTANKVKGIRAASAVFTDMAYHDRLHDDTNILGLAADWVEPDSAKDIVKIWLETEFSGEDRYARRLTAVQQYEQTEMN